MTMRPHVPTARHCDPEAGLARHFHARLVPAGSLLGMSRCCHASGVSDIAAWTTRVPCLARLVARLNALHAGAYLRLNA